MSNELNLIAALTLRLRTAERAAVTLRTDLTQLAREAGPPGPQGLPGPAGKDGKDGRDGKDGEDGKDGRDGKDGEDGKDGKDGERGPAPAHRWRGTKLSFKKPDGTWGKEVDLAGERGKPGTFIVSSGGGGGGAPTERILHTDYSDTRYAYVGFASRTARIDYSVSPPLEQTAASGDWENRLTLDYL